MKKRHIILLGIIFLAAFLRLFMLPSVPPSASLDEASIGWNAYSILHTGKDEYGYSFPILLRAYDDYRPALYVYSVIPFVKFFGLNVVSVRLPSVIFSILTVFAVYFLVKEMFEKQKIISKAFNPSTINSEHLAFFVSFLLAISPWHIYISRLGHEVNLGLSFFVFAVLFFLKRRIYLSTFFFLLSFISYQSEKIFIPIMVIGIFLIFKDELLALKKKIAIAVILGLIILTPFIKATLSPDALLRYKATNVFDANESRFIDQSLLLQKADSSKDLIGKLIYNRRFLSLQIVTEGYLSHFNPVWLFTNSAGDKHKVPGIGLLYIWTLPFILLGLYFLIAKKFDFKIKALIFLWFLASPVAASIATESPHALRSFTFLPTWEIFASIGIISSYNFVKKRKIEKPAFLIFAFLIFFSLSSLYEQYFKVFPKTQSGSFQYALSKAVDYAVKNGKDYRKVVFSNSGNLYQSYMFFLFYSKYDPVLYQRYGGTISGGYSSIHKFTKYEFRPINIGIEEKGDLYIGNYQELNLKGKIASQVKTLEVISNLDDEKAIKIVTK